ncbi:MAG: CdaR family protein [bacterium]|nr:CdaR family protein [bacterium]
MQKSLRALIVENLLWFCGSLVVAVIVWLIAVTQSNPVEQWRLAPRLPIRVIAQEGFLVTDQSETTASVQLRASRSVREALENDDVIVTADLSALAPGTHVVPLTVTVARQAQIVDTSPRQITVSIEIEESRLKPVEVVLAAEPPLDYRAGQPEYSVRAATVSGPLSLVQQVDAAQIALDLSDQRTTFTDTARLVPVDVDGNLVEGVTLDPQVVEVRLVIEPRDDVKPMRVLANTEGDLPQGYVLRSFDYAPQSIYVSGPPEVLNSLSDTLFTEPVDFSNRTGDFTETVAIQLPDPRLILIPSREVTVSVGIEPQIITRQFDRVPVEVIGQEDGMTIQTAPEAVSVLLTGPQPALEALAPDDVRVIVDVSALNFGANTAVTPITTIGDAAADAISVQVIPAAIDVRIDPESTPEATTSGSA